MALSFIRASSRTILSNFAVLKYHKYLSSSSLCCLILSYTISYYTILYYIILNYTILYYTITYSTWDKKSCNACGSQCCKVKLNNFTTEGPKTVCNMDCNMDPLWYNVIRWDSHMYFFFLSRNGAVQFFFLTPTRNMFLAVLWEYIFYTFEWFEVFKMSDVFWAKLYCRMNDLASFYWVRVFLAENLNLPRRHKT